MFSSKHAFVYSLQCLFPAVWFIREGKYAIQTQIHRSATWAITITAYHRKHKWLYLASESQQVILFEWWQSLVQQKERKMQSVLLMHVNGPLHLIFGPINTKASEDARPNKSKTCIQYLWMPDITGLQHQWLLEQTTTKVLPNSQFRKKQCIAVF